MHPAPIDTQTTEIRQRLGFFVLGATFVGFLTLVALLLFIPMTINALGNAPELALGALLFLLIVGVMVVGTAHLVRRVLWGRAVVMRLAPEGLWHRISTRGQIIPWPSISRIVLRGGKGGGLKITLPPELLRSLFPSSFAAALYSMNWLDGRGVLSLHVGGLEMRQRDVTELVKQYAAAHGGYPHGA